MIKTIVAASLLAVAFAAPAYAAEMVECDEASMMKLNEMIKADTDPAMKEAAAMATEQMEKAEMAMKHHDMEDCSKHLTKAKADLG
ncbi:MAG: hypothetical protein ACREDN_08520 [Aestuariivirga sp.]